MELPITDALQITPVDEKRNLITGIVDVILHCIRAVVTDSQSHTRLLFLLTHFKLELYNVVTVTDLS